jgi:hypothetical protein
MTIWIIWTIPSIWSPFLFLLVSDVVIDINDVEDDADKNKGQG